MVDILGERQGWGEGGKGKGRDKDAEGGRQRGL